jgi:hypothetical protein
VRGVLGHSRKLDLRILLGLVDGQEVGALTAQAMDVFGVVARSIRQALADLEWGGYVTRRQVGKQARSSDTVVLTRKGRRALVDDAVAADLLSLPQRHRIYRAALLESSHTDHVRAMLDEWRREMGRGKRSDAERRDKDDDLAELAEAKRDLTFRQTTEDQQW